MDEYISERALRHAQYIIEENQTVRGAAVRFGVSKSTVHKDVTVRLKHIDPALCAQVRPVLERNKSESHLRGGEATKRKYEKRR